MGYCHQHPISPPRVFVFHKKPLCLWKTVQILFTFPCRYAVCIPVFAHKLPLFTQSLPEFPAISCLVHPQFIFILHDRIYRGPPLPPPTGGIVMHETQQPRDPERPRETGQSGKNSGEYKFMLLQTVKRTETEQHEKRFRHW